MSIKPAIISTETLASQVQELGLKKDELTLTRDEAAERLRTIEQVINENATLAKKTKEQVAESVALYLEEWAKVKELYPEIRLGILQKIVDRYAAEEERIKKKR